jgi:hypothetical protein
MTDRIGGSGGNAAAAAAAAAAAEAARQAAEAARRAAEEAARKAAEAAARAAAQRSGFDGASKTQRMQQALGNTPALKADDPKLLTAQVALHKLAGTPVLQEPLAQLGLKDAQSLHAFAAQLGEAPSGTPLRQLGEALRNVPDAARGQLLSQLSLLNPALTRLKLANPEQLAAALQRLPPATPGSYDASSVTASMGRFHYAPEGDGTSVNESIAMMELNGGRPDYGADGALNCVQAAAYAQEQFANQNPPVETEIVVADGHAVLRMPDGRYYDPTNVMDGSGRDPFLTPEEAKAFEGVDGVTVQEREAIATAARQGADAAGPNATPEARAQAAVAAADQASQSLNLDGTAGEASATTEANDGDSATLGASDAAQVDQAYNDAIAAGKSPEEATIIAIQKLDELTAAHANDPAYVDALIAGSQEHVDAASRILGDRVAQGTDDPGGDGPQPTRDLVAGLSNIASRASPTGQGAISNSLAQAVPDQGDLNQLDDAFQEHLANGGSPVLGQALVGALSTAGKTTASGELQPNVTEGVEEFRAEVASEMYAQVHDPQSAIFWVMSYEGDPARQAEAIRLLKEQGLLEGVAQALYPPVDPDTGQPYSPSIVATDDHRASFASALDAARNSNPPVLTEQDIRSLGAGPAAAEFQQLNQLSSNPVQGVGLSAESQTALDAVDRAQSEYDDAKAKVDELNKELESQLAELGPGLTDAQKQAYIEEFKARHADEYGAEAEKAAALAAALANPQLDQAVKENPAAASMVFDATQKLADVPGYGDQVLAWETRVQSDPALKAAYVAGVENFETRLTEQIEPAAMSSLMSELIATYGSVEAALEPFRATVEPLFGLRGVPGQFQELWDDVNAAARGDYSRLQQLAGNVNDMSGFAKLKAGLSLVVGAASAIQAGREGEFATMVSGIASTSAQGLELVAGAIKSLSDSGKLAQYAGSYTDDLMDFATWAERFTPMLSLLVSGITLVQDIQKFKDDPGVGAAFTILGDSVSVLGSALSTFPPAYPIGQVINLIGSVISTLGGVVDWFEDRHERNSEMNDILRSDRLQQAGLTREEADAYASSHDSIKIAAELGLSPEQIQTIAAAQPGVFDTEGYIGEIIDAAKAFGIPPDQFTAWMTSLSHEQAEALASELIGLQSSSFGQEVTDPATIYYFLQGNAPAAAEFLRNNASPEVRAQLS